MLDYSMRYPEWLKKPIPKNANNLHIRKYLAESLHTVCEAALCPNRGECFAKKTVTFLILGEACTRRCRFCAVTQGSPQPVDPDEAQKIAAAARRLELQHVVITSVTRDDLPDGGAGHFAAVVTAVRMELPAAAIEILTPDFQGDITALKKALSAKPDVFNHNVETVPRLYAEIRPQANYRRSLSVLQNAKQITGPNILTKSGLMLGLGETADEIRAVLRDLKDSGVDIVTLGQYLAPSQKHYPVRKFIPPAGFAEYKEYGEKELGFRAVFAGPLVRSSYMAGEVYAATGCGKK